MASAIEKAYQEATHLAQNHYENFPVGSFLLPRKLRRPIHVIYAFARKADDIADEGNDSPEERLEKLGFFWLILESMEKENLANIPNQGSHPSAIDPLFLALQAIIQTYKLPYALFFDLLKAFKQDIIQKDYQNFDAVLQYCQHSANPIGRLLLHLVGEASPQNLAASDALCTALQLINFVQDMTSDLIQRDRCYFPLDEMQSLGISKKDLLLQKNSDEILHFMSLQILRAQALLDQGSILGTRLKGLFGFEIRLIIAAAHYMAQALLRRKSPYERPTIKFWHWPKILLTRYRSKR